jgi:hypothetical protein
VGAEPVGPRRGDEAMHRGVPVELLKAKPEPAQRARLLGLDHRRQRAVERARGDRLVEDAKLGREPELERVVRYQVSARRVHRADSGRQQPVRVVDPARLEQAATRALLQLGGGLVGERRRDDGVRARASARDRLQELAGELVRLAGAGAGGDDLELAHAPAPERPQWSP